MTAADRFSVSGLDYMSWANKMVDEGKMYWPNKTSYSVIEATEASASYSLTNIACGVLVGSESSYDDGETVFCDFVAQYVSATLMGADYILKDGLCEDNEDCTMIVEIALGVAGGYLQDGVTSVCPGIFAELYSSCNGAVGGSAQISLTDSSGTQTGTVSAQFYDNDGGATCAANTDTDICQQGLFN